MTDTLDAGTRSRPGGDHDLPAKPWPRLSVVIPLYNEEALVDELYRRVRAALDGLEAASEIVLVDDGSNDRTWDLVIKHASEDRAIVAVRLRRNFGQTAALAAGFDHARGDVVVAMDGDLQHDPAEIPAFLAKIDEGYDIVSGWRTKRSDNLWLRQMPSKMANWIVRKMSGVEIHDFGTTFKAYRREVLDEIDLYSEMHRFIPALASRTGATVVEIPITDDGRQAGRSKYGLGRTFRVLMDLITVKFLLDYLTRPLHFFGLLAMTSFVMGAAVSGVVVFDKLVYGQPIMEAHGPLALLGCVLILGSFIFLSNGLVGELVARTYFEGQGKPTYSIREVRRYGPRH
jgi:glycosyltransferase involved in cell wall biosynthesis